MDKKSSSFSVGFLGALMGVLSGAALVFFSDPKNRMRAKRKVEDIENDVEEKINELREMVDSANKTTRRRIAKNLKSVANQLD